jgi:hypothetical protein
MTRSNQFRHRTLAAIALGIGLGGFTWTAMANRGPDDRTVATQVLAQYAASASPASSHALAEANRALQRAEQARAAGDVTHAKHLEGLAREWAEMAQDVTRATSAEGRADQKQRAAASATLNIRKTQALIETLVARRARAQGELQQLHAASSAGIPSAALSAARLRPQSTAPAATTKAAPAGSK